MAPVHHIVIMSVFALVAVFFFIKWRGALYCCKDLAAENNINYLINSASIGGYYFLDTQKNEEKFSLNMIKMFNIDDKIQSFKQFHSVFLAKDRREILALFESLKNGDKNSFIFNSNAKISGKIRNFQFVGNRIDDQADNAVAVVIWFYDTTQYTQQIKRLDSLTEKLQAELSDYLSILNNIPMPIWRRDESYDIKYCNDSYKEFVEVSNDSLKNNIIPELDENVREASEKILKTEKSLQLKKHLVSAGERRFFKLSEVAVDKGFFGYALDITSEEEIEKELGRHISAHADLLESSSSAMAIYGSDTKLKFYNNAFMKLWNFEENWLNSNPTYAEVLEILREKRMLPEQANFKKFREEQVNFFKNLIKPHNEFFYLPDGKTLRVIVIPHALGGLLFAYEDMTDRFAIEGLYNTLIEVQQETLDNLREGVAVFGTDGTLKLYNPMYEKMWPEEISVLDTKPRDKDLMEISRHLFVFDDWVEFKNEWLRRPTTKEPVSVKRTERTDGKVIDKLVVLLPDGDHMVSYVDVTDTTLLERSLRDRNDALEEADRLKTEFLANVSYELRTPLTSILGFAEALEKEYFGKMNERQKEYTHNISESSEQLLALINDILDLASIEAGYMVLDVKRFSIKSMLLSLVSAVEARCNEAGLKLLLDCADDAGEIVGDENRIRQILLNVVSNSIKFTKKGGKIIVGAKQNSDKDVLVWVEDSGIGIAAKDKKQVFDKFFKSDSALVMKKSGTGLGLSVVKNIIELHGGKVKLDSKEKKGTKVTFQLKRKSKKLKTDEN